ncbi:hypothetical protein GW17_00061137 [Ensete ventricosum]|nr:hypothetical protein GW17_00061137 [Ensete ventricosum]
MVGAYRGGAYGRRQRLRLGHSGWLPVARPQGAALRLGLPFVRAVAPTGAAPAPVRCRPRAAAPAAGVAAHADG